MELRWDPTWTMPESAYLSYTSTYSHPRYPHACELWFPHPVQISRGIHQPRNGASVLLQAEMALTKMQRQGFRPREYAYCGLIAAYSLAGQHENALAVRMRAQHEGMQVRAALSTCPTHA